ncbi:MAG: molecular chaperone HtpG [Oscillospiraceae bacterium]|jgi:molecular chaperone HtpG|nr:molecular chaperone HtpG [Oscillospiraceae bacterium]
MSKKKNFKAESKRMLELMIHSIYTHKEIFLRELISNASDAIDKRYYHALKNEAGGLGRDSFAIDIDIDKNARTLTIADNGCGMTDEELENNLGTIARSGSLQFKSEQEQPDEIDVIGQFGVGFYSAFMVADEITVESLKVGETQGYRWHSNGVDGFTVDPCDKTEIGTVVTLRIKESTEADDFNPFLESHHIQSLVKRYSDYIRYPIRMDIESSVEKPRPADAPEDAPPEWETISERKTVNSMSPLWRKAKSEVQKEEYDSFYQNTFHDGQAPLRTLHASAEGAITYQSLLFIPSSAPYQFYSKDFEKGLRLYASGVMIMEHCKDLLPDCFGFVRGVVDSQDLSLNISREMLQQDKQLKVIAKHIEKKIKNELKDMLENDRETYRTFYDAFGIHLKYALYSSYGMLRELLLDLLQFKTTTQDTPQTFAEYVARMPEGQTAIYYAAGASVEQIKRLPQCERLTDKGIEVLCATEDVDEFLFKMLFMVEEKEIHSITEASELEDASEKQSLEQETKARESLLNSIKTALNGQVEQVILTSRLKSHPVCLSTTGGITLEMERVLAQQPAAAGGSPMKAQRVLELNISHPIYEKLISLQEHAPEQVADYANLLYNQAVLMEGLAIEDPVAFSNAICKLMV